MKFSFRRFFFKPNVYFLLFVCIFSDPAAGASDDWYRGGLGVRYAFTTELRYNYLFWITHSKLGSLVHYPKEKRLFMYFWFFQIDFFSMMLNFFFCFIIEIQEIMDLNYQQTKLFQVEKNMWLVWELFSKKLSVTIMQKFKMAVCIF